MTPSASHASSVGFVEAHGTGTRLGDPIEYDALASIYSSAGTPRGACFLGSVKSNLGHATTAAGITSLVKVLGALKSGVVPPTLHVGAGNPAIRLAEGPFRVNAEPEPWAAEQWAKACRDQLVRLQRHQCACRCRGSSATGARCGHARPRTSWFSRLARRISFASRRSVWSLISHAPIRRMLRDVAFTLLIGRRHLPHRLALVARDIDDLVRRLSAWLAGASDSGVKVASVDANAAAVDASRRS